MTRDEVVTLLGQRFGNRTDLGSRIVTEMQLAQSTKLERHHWLPWFLEGNVSPLTVVVGTAEIALPAGFLGEIEDEVLWIREPGATTYGTLDRLGKDQIALQSDNVRPQAYTIDEANLVLMPGPPDIAYELKWRAYLADTVLTANVENKWLKYAPDLMIAVVGQALCHHTQRFDALSVYQQDEQKAWDTLLRLHVSREEANRERLMEA